MTEDGPDFDRMIEFIRSIYGDGFVPLHRPLFGGNEKAYLAEAIDSNFVSSVGKKVNEFEEAIASFAGVDHAIAVVNGTAALHLSLVVAGVQQNDEVISQALTFVATCNAISYCGAKPVFIDVDKDTAGMSPTALLAWLEQNAVQRDGRAFNKRTTARLSSCVPMHTFGLPVRIREIAKICDEWGIPLIEDAAESLGSFIEKKHTGSFGQLATFSFNGNKIVTTGGGGMIITNNAQLAHQAKHLSTTAKVPHPYEFVHDAVGYNYRLPNLNAALGCAQMETLPDMLEVKAEISNSYKDFGQKNGWTFMAPITGTTANNWLNATILEDVASRNAFIECSNKNGVMARPVWTLMSELDIYRHCESDGLTNSRWLADRIVNLPSSVPDKDIWRIRQ